MALITLGANAITALPSGIGGKVLQVVQAVKTDTFTATSFSSWNFVDVTGLSVSITPSSASNKILITGYISGVEIMLFIVLIMEVQ
jgi:hypothetical protein